MTRPLHELVKKEDFVLDSEYLTTLVVVVPSLNKKDWLSKYEQLTNYVVPRSSTIVLEDAEYTIFTVTLFKRVEDEFRHKCREHHFTVREFKFDDEAVAKERADLQSLQAEQKRLYAPLVRYLKINFSEAFIAYMHIKVLRVFVESVLRYGLPVKFFSSLLVIEKKTHKKLRDLLNNLYSYLDKMGASPLDMADTGAVGLIGLPGAGTEYYPYVCFSLSTQVLDAQHRV